MVVKPALRLARQEKELEVGRERERVYKRPAVGQIILIKRSESQATETKSLES